MICNWGHFATDPPTPQTNHQLLAAWSIGSCGLSSQPQLMHWNWSLALLLFLSASSRWSKKKKKKFYKDITLYRRVVWLYSSNVAQAEYFLKINGFHWMIDRGREVPLQPLTTQVNNQLVVHWGSWLVIDWSLIQGGWMEVRVHLDFSF